MNRNYRALEKTSWGGGLNGKRGCLNHHHRILVVDDDEDIRRLNTEVLVNSGYTVDVVADGVHAWDTLQINSYDLLLTDYDMPRMNGLNLIKKLRAAHTAIRVILVSGTASTKELNRHPWLQIDATLCKPYTPGELLACVGKVLFAVNLAWQTVPSPNSPAEQILNT